MSLVREVEAVVKLVLKATRLAYRSWAESQQVDRFPLSPPRLSEEDKRRLDPAAILPVDSRMVFRYEQKKGKLENYNEIIGRFFHM